MNRHTTPKHFQDYMNLDGKINAGKLPASKGVVTSRRLVHTIAFLCALQKKLQKVL